MNTTVFIKPNAILANCTVLNPLDKEYLKHPIIDRFGTPSQPIYIDQSNVEIANIQYKNAMILPIVNGQLELIQCAVLQNKKNIQVIPDGRAKGFAYYGELNKDKPVIITYSLEAFFKVTQTGYPVVLVILSHLCNTNKIELQMNDFEKIEFIINQLSEAGYKHLFMPVRLEQIQFEGFQQLNENTAINFLNQCDGNNHIDLNADEDVANVHEFLKDTINLLPKKMPLSKGHLAKPMKWEDGYFHILETGIFFVEVDKNGNESKRFISSPILVKAKTRDNSSNNWGVLLEWLDDSGIKHTQAISMELFQTDGADLRKLLAYQGVKIAPDNRSRKLFQCYLMTYMTELSALCVERVGWHNNVFVLPHTQIGQNSNDEIIVYQANNSLENRYQSRGTLELWKKNVSKLVEQHSRLVFALGVAFAGQLLTPLNQQGGGFHFKGGSSKGKSTALNLASSIWGNPKQFRQSWKATGNSLEHTAYIHNDGFLALDEIGEISNPKELGNIIYMLANGLGKGRLTKQLIAKQLHQWKLFFLSNGERSLKDIMLEQGQKTKLGQEIRLADIDIDQSEYGIFDCINFAEDGSKQAQLLDKQMMEYYGVAGIAWLDYLTSNKDLIMEEALELFNHYRNLISKGINEGHILRVANSFALIAVAGELATRGNITGWKPEIAIKSVQQVFNYWLSNFEQVGHFEDREMILHVKSFLEANETSRFESCTPDPLHPEKIAHRVGYWKINDQGEKLFLVMPEQFKNEVCKGYDSRKVAKALQVNNLVEHDYEKLSKTVRLPARKGTLKVYAVKESILGWDG